jgi:hypothetical protein
METLDVSVRKKGTVIGMCGVWHGVRWYSFKFNKFNPAFFGEKQKAVIPHPPYSPDLAPCDFFLFPKMKLQLKWRRFDNVEELQAESQRVLDTQIEKDFQEAFQKWRRRWDRCLHAGGNYFEGDGGR